MVYMYTGYPTYEHECTWTCMIREPVLVSFRKIDEESTRIIRQRQLCPISYCIVVVLYKSWKSKYSTSHVSWMPNLFSIFWCDHGLVCTRCCGLSWRWRWTQGAVWKMNEDCIDIESTDVICSPWPVNAWNGMEPFRSVGSLIQVVR